MERQAPDTQKSVFDWLTHTETNSHEYVTMLSGTQTSLKMKMENKQTNEHWYVCKLHATI